MNQLEKKIGEIGEWLGAGSLNFFGRQFAGKDTQAANLGSYFGMSRTDIISGGDIMRNSDIPADVRAAMDKGDLSPTEEYQKVVLPFLKQPALQGRPLLLSSVGRMSGEEVPVMETAAAAGHPIKAVPYLRITENEAFRRLEASPPRGRADDNPQGLRQRLEEFSTSTVHVLNAYEDQGLLVVVDAMVSEEDVFIDLVHQLHERAREA